jgi:Arc/MetJ family transcription regulator
VSDLSIWRNHLQLPGVGVLAAEIPLCVRQESEYRYNGSMKTTIDIPENELRDAMRFTRAATKREAVVKVLEEFNRRRRMAELVKHAGTFSDQFPTNDEIEAIDVKRDRTLNARPRR